MRARLDARPSGSFIFGVALTFLYLISRHVAHAADESHPRDPLESMNRGIFTFNDTLDRYAFEPVARGWDFVLPDGIQSTITNFFDNIRFPVVFANSLFQGRVDRAGTEFGRFVLNTTAGIGGLLDPATELGLKREEADFGQTLGVWGVPPGPYLVIPILGPSDVRDAAAIIPDNLMTVYGFFIGSLPILTARGVDLVNDRAAALETIDEARRASLDFYAATRSAFFESRARMIDPSAETAPRDDLYFPDDDGAAPGLMRGADPGDQP